MRKEELIVDIPNMTSEYLSVLIEFGIISQNNDYLELTGLFENLPKYSTNEISLDGIVDTIDPERFYNAIYNEEKQYIHDLMDKAIMELVTLVNTLQNRGHQFKMITVERILGDSMILSLYK